MCPSAHDSPPPPNFRPVGSILMKRTATRHYINELYEKKKKFRGPGVDSCFIKSTVVSAITPWLLFVRVIGCGDRELGCEEKEMGENRDRSKEWVSHDISMGVNSKLLFVLAFPLCIMKALVPQKEPQETLMRVLVRLVGIRNSELFASATGTVIYCETVTRATCFLVKV
jgi:hypothetical protein